MALSYPAVLDLEEKDVLVEYTDTETILYALGIGFGADPQNQAELPFIYEKDLCAVPTLGTVIAGSVGVNTSRLGVNYKLVLHGEEETILHSPMPASAKLIADSSVVEVYDKGEGKGALIIRRTVLRDHVSDELVATLNRTIFARGDGGCGGAKTPAPVPHPTPDREPDKSFHYPTRLDQAALYRLNGDRNPLHIDPELAKSAGFEAPILHGLCTYGITCRAVLEGFCQFDAARLASHAARFSSPVFPGETLRIDLWQDGNTISFQASVPARDSVVIKNGKSLLR